VSRRCRCRRVELNDRLGKRAVVSSILTGGSTVSAPYLLVRASFGVEHHCEIAGRDDILPTIASSGSATAFRSAPHSSQNLALSRRPVPHDPHATSNVNPAKPIQESDHPDCSQDKDVPPANVRRYLTPARSDAIDRRLCRVSVSPPAAPTSPHGAPVAVRAVLARWPLPSGQTANGRSRSGLSTAAPRSGEIAVARYCARRNLRE